MIGRPHFLGLLLFQDVAGRELTTLFNGPWVRHDLVEGWKRGPSQGLEAHEGWSHRPRCL